MPCQLEPGGLAKSLSDPYDLHLNRGRLAPKMGSAFHLSHFVTFRLCQPTKMASAKQVVDLIINAAHVVPVVPRNVVLHDHAVVVKAARIVDLLPREAAAAKYEAATVKELPRHIVTPGLINMHTHSPMTLLRGLSDDKPLITWLTEDVWPTEGKFVDADFVRDGMEHAAAEMLRGGTTCFNDMFFFPGEICEVLERVGMRGAVGQTMLEFPTRYAAGADEYFAKAEPFFEKYQDHELITVTIAPHAPYTVTDDNLVRADGYAKKHNVRFNIHLHETPAECHDSEHLIKESMSCHQSDQKLRPIANFKRLGLLSDHLIAVHMTQLTDEEIQDLAAAKTHVVHCPTSNLKLASGICRVSELLKHGVNVTLGTDGCASNNSLNMFAEMKLAAILAKVESMESTNVPAMTALEMATINGARALGLEKDIGSIEVGKRADVIAIECDSIEMIPMYNAVSHVVYVAGREQYVTFSRYSLSVCVLTCIACCSACRTCGSTASSCWTRGSSRRSTSQPSRRVFATGSRRSRSSVTLSRASRTEETDFQGWGDVDVVARMHLKSTRHTITIDNGTFQRAPIARKERMKMLRALIASRIEEECAKMNKNVGTVHAQIMRSSRP